MTFEVIFSDKGFADSGLFRRIRKDLELLVFIHIF